MITDNTPRLSIPNVCPEPVYATLADLHAEVAALDAQTNRIAARLDDLHHNLRVHAPELARTRRTEAPIVRQPTAADLQNATLPESLATLADLHAARDTIIDRIDVLDHRVARAASDLDMHVMFTHKLP